MRLYSILFLLGSLFLVACVTVEDTETPTTSACPPNCQSGSTGVTTTVTAPLEGGNVYANDQLFVSVKFEDNGESNVDDGVVCVTGLDSEEFNDLGGCSCNSFYINVDDPKDAHYESTTLGFGPSYVSSTASGDRTLSVITRYGYRTYGVFEACLVSETYEEATCSVTGDKLQVSSSGPISVENIEEELTPVGSDAVTLRLHVTASMTPAANEKIISLTETSSLSCVLERSLEEEAVITVPVSVTLRGNTYDCSALRFEEGEEGATTSCKISNLPVTSFIGGEETYIGWVELEYGWQTIESIGFTVVQEG